MRDTHKNSDAFWGARPEHPRSILLRDVIVLNHAFGYLSEKRKTLHSSVICFFLIYVVVHFPAPARPSTVVCGMLFVVHYFF